MFLSLLQLNPTASDVQRDLRDVSAIHRRIMQAFPSVIDPEVGARAFYGVLHRLDVDRTGTQILLYVQSQVEPDWSQLPAGYLHPDIGMRVKPVGDLYASVKSGRILRFRLRANPTRKIDTKTGPSGERRNGRRVPLGGMEQQVAWLAEKAQHGGFELLQVSVAASGAAELVTSHGTGRTFQGIVFEGRLMVRDADRFKQVLADGIGPAKAFGFGLLSIGPD